MATPAWVPLATTTLSSSASSVTFGSIPASYRDLVLIGNARTTTTNARGYEICGFQFNSDTGSNYSRVRMRFNGSTYASDSGTGGNLEFEGIIDQSTASGTFNMVKLQVLDYSATDKHKSVLYGGNNQSGQTGSYAGRWANTAAVTSIKFFTIQGGTFDAGSTFSLWGRNAL